MKSPTVFFDQLSKGNKVFNMLFIQSARQSISDRLLSDGTWPYIICKKPAKEMTGTVCMDLSPATNTSEKMPNISVKMIPVCKGRGVCEGAATNIMYDLVKKSGGPLEFQLPCLICGLIEGIKLCNSCKIVGLVLLIRVVDA